MHSLELEAEMARVNPQALSSNRPPKLYSNQEAEVQAEVPIPPFPRSRTFSEYPVDVKSGFPAE